MYCKMFVSTLQGTALEWFVSLPTGHITNFQQFSKLFVEQYIVNKAPPRVSYDLFDIRQYQRESLRDYLNRFGAQMLRSPAKDEEMLVYAFKKGVMPGPFCEALIAGILLAKEMGARVLMAKSDSLLVTGQVTGEFQAKDPQMAAYLEYVQEFKSSFVSFEVVHVPREQNARADLLAKLASSGKGG